MFFEDFLFSPPSLEMMIQFDLHIYFSDGLKSPTSLPLCGVLDQRSTPNGPLEFCLQVNDTSINLPAETALRRLDFAKVEARMTRKTIGHSWDWKRRSSTKRQKRLHSLQKSFCFPYLFTAWLRKNLFFWGGFWLRKSPFLGSRISAGPPIEKKDSSSVN